MKLPLLSLFCGAGGLDCGFRQEHFRTILAIDNDDAAIRSFNFNAKGKIAVRGDLTTMSGSDIVSLLDVSAPGIRPVGVIGGPPCQGFSNGNVYANPDDPRNQLPFRYAEILRHLTEHYEMQFFVFENVLGLASNRHQARLQEIKCAFEEAGYRVYEQRLNAISFGVPQSRPRLFLIGIHQRIQADQAFTFPLGTQSVKTVGDAISALPNPAYFERGLKASAIPHHPNHWTMKPKSPKFATTTFTTGRSFKRLAWSEPSPTVAYGNREIHVHPSGKRRLSVYEAMLLQGFPPTYRLHGNLSEQVSQVCNAVPPPVARALAESLYRFLSGKTTTMQPHYSTIEEHSHG